MYRIGELAKACGVKADTLRFYEKNGLISPGIRNESGYRLYGEQDRRRLEFIIRAKSVGFSLADIGELLSLDTNKARVTCQEVKAVADAASSAPTPTAAAKMCTKHPAVIPSPATMPARVPDLSALVTM